MPVSEERRMALDRLPGRVDLRSHEARVSDGRPISLGDEAATDPKPDERGAQGWKEISSFLIPGSERVYHLSCGQPLVVKQERSRALGWA